MFLLYGLVGSVLVSYLVAFLGYKFVQKSAAKFLHPKRSLAKSSPADYGINTWQDVRFHSADGLELGGWFIPAKPNKATLIFVHGIRGNRSSLLAQASFLVHEGFGALLIELRNHGASEGTLTTMSAQEMFDVEGAIRFLKARSEVDAASIGIMGHSLGAATAIRSAARQEELKFVIAQASFADLPESMHQAARTLAGFSASNRIATALLHPFVCLMIRYAQRQVGEKAENISPKRDLANLNETPCLFIHGVKDKTIDAANSQLLFEHARGEKELLLLENTGHTCSRSEDYEVLAQNLLAFVQKHGEAKTLDLTMSELDASELRHPMFTLKDQKSLSA